MTGKRKAAGRKAVVERKTKETQIKCSLELDGAGESQVGTGVGFLDHMLELLAFNAAWNLRLEAKGDLQVDEHHTVEDCAIALGQALRKAIGETPVRRYGFFILPMDEALATAAVDLGGRPFCKAELGLKRKEIGKMPSELLEDFLIAFANSAGAAVNLKAEGRNDHHKAEACFKALGRALEMACEKDAKRTGTSTKGRVKLK